MGDGEAWEVLCAEMEIFRGPASKDDALVPGPFRVWWDGFNGLCNQADDVGCVVIELDAY